MPELLSPDQKHAFHRDGILLIPGFFDLERDIHPILSGIYRVIGQVMQRHGVEDTRPPFSPDGFDAGFQSLLALDRSYGAEIYDAVKQIPAFVRLIAHHGLEKAFTELRPGAVPGIAAGGSGIRIDNPNEEEFRAPWHQEYPAQLRSVDGIVFWSPLLPITPDLGPVEFCLGSQKEGVVPVFTHDSKHPEKRGAYALTLQGEAELISKYERVAPCTSPGDLVVVDWLVIHASGQNVATRSRWAMQLRYFNFADPIGMQHGWKGSYAAGVDFRDVHPELCADQGSGGEH